jgi:PAS domain S-box-containing protein
MNRVAEGLTGWRHVEAVGRRFSEVFHIVHQRTGAVCENPVDKVLSSGQIADLAEDTILIARDGTRRNISDSGSPINNPDNEIIGAVLVFRDITEEKRIEAELLKIKKLESVGVLAGGIAHDFNNILVAILGNVSLARQRLKNSEDADALLENTEKAALRAKNLTSQLLTFSRGGEPVLETASLESMIKESAEFVLRGSNVKITWDIPVDLWLVNIDSSQIGQVVQNIVLNARQAMLEEGEVKITCRNCQNCGTGKKDVRGRCVRVIISDNGVGISDDVLPKIFDPYFTTKEDGSGLGLAICHSIINKHGGNIHVDSSPGSGTTFTLQLQVSKEQKIDQLPVSSPSISGTGKARILIMDDDQMIRELSRQMLEYLGHYVVTSKDGREALEIYAEAMRNNQPFDLIMMDLTIPGGMGGKKTIKELLKIDPEACAIVSSGYSHDPVMADYTKYGFKAVVVKPYQIDDLEKAVQETLLTKQA